MKDTSQTGTLDLILRGTILRPTASHILETWEKVRRECIENYIPETVGRKDVSPSDGKGTSQSEVAGSSTSAGGNVIHPNKTEDRHVRRFRVIG